MTAPATINTPARAIRLAMQDAGKLQEGDDPNSDQYAEHLGRLNDLTNTWQTQGLRLWLNEDVPVTLVAGTSSYFFGTAGIKPTRIIQGYYQDSNDVRRPLIAMSRDEYTRLSQLTQEGPINSYFVDKQQLTLNVFFWLTPDTEAATGFAGLIMQQPVDQLIQLTDTINFPIEWFMALRWALAEEISVSQPMQIAQFCARNAGRYFEALNNWDVEDADTMFQPDQRATQSQRSFR